MAGLLIKLVEVHLDLVEKLRGRVVTARDQQNVVVPDCEGTTTKSSPLTGSMNGSSRLRSSM
jgi:hypothetical protein